LIDRTNGDLRAIYDALSENLYQPLFFEVSGSWGAAPATGFGAEYASSFAIVSVLRAEREGKGCGEDLTSFLYRANGNEPSWQLVVKETEMHFTRLGTPALTISEPDLTVDSGTVRVDGGEVSATIENKRCTDSMSGSVFALSATVTAGGSTVAGCAAEGATRAN
jgi:putative lipoprotein